MYKLTTRMRSVPTIVVAAICLLALFVCNKAIPSLVYDLPLYWLLPGPLLCLIALPFAYRKASPKDKIELGLTVLAFFAFYGVFAVFFRAINPLDDSHGLINVVALVVTSLGALVSTAALKALTPDEVSAVRTHPSTSTQLEQPVEPTTEKPQEKPEKTKSTGQGMRGAARTSATNMPSPNTQKPSSSATNLMGLLDTLTSTDEEETGDKIKAHPAKAAAVKPGASASNLQPPSSPAVSASSAQSTAKPGASANNLQAAGSAPTAAETAPAAGETGEQKRPATSTATRLQAQKRKSTNTYIKLQALSASGTGSTPRKSESAEGESGDSLKSMLDRLDTRFEEPHEDPMSLTEEVAMDSLFAQESLLTPQQLADSNKAASPPPTPPQPTPSQPSPSANVPAASASPAKSAEAPSLSAMLDSLDSPSGPATGGAAGLGASKFGSMSSANRMANPLAQNRSPASAAKPTPPQPSTAAKPAAPTTPAGTKPTTPAAAAATPATPSRPASAPTPPVTPKPATAPTPATPKPPAAPAKPDASAAGAGTNATAKPPAPANFSQQPAKPEDKPPVQPAKPAVEPVKAETPRPAFQKTDTTRSDTGMLMVDQKALNQKPPAKVEAPPAEPQKPEPVKAEAAHTDSLLGAVDKEIDDIFSSLVPAEAQKEVHSAPVIEKPKQPQAKAPTPPSNQITPTPKVPPAAPKPQEPKPQPKPEPKPEPKSASTPAAASAKPKDSNLFETGLDQEIDDIFSNLVPIEAQKEVGYSHIPEEKAEISSAPDTVAEEELEPADAESTAAPVVAPIDEPEEPALFQESAVDKELDDIFSSLAPSEAHRSVNKETLSKLKPLDPVEAKTEDKDQPISFAPPDESKQEKNEERELSREERLKRELENMRPGKFNETLASLPSMQSTIEGLLNNLAASESAQEESFAPPEPSEESFSPTAKAEPVAHRVMDLLESLESGETTEAPETKSAERHEHQSMPEESSSGDSVDDLFGESQAASERAEAENEQAATESANESAPSHTTSDTEALAEEASETVELKDEESSSIAESTAEGQLESAPTAENETKSEPEPTDSKEREPEADSTEVASAETEIEVPSSETASTDVSKTESVESEVSEPASGETESVQAPPPSSEPESAEAEEQEKPHEASESSKAEESPDEEELAETPEDKPAVAEESPEVVRAKAQLKEFGKLSVKPGTASSTTEPAGTMKSIGKLLIDVAAVENIIKAGESGTIGSGLSTARVISAQRGEGIKALLNKIDTFDGVVGSVIVGHDGLVIASTVTGGMDKDTLGALSVACVSTSNLATKKLEIGKLRQMVMLTDKNLTVLTDVDVGILAVFLSDNDVGRVDGVLGAIHDTIHGN